MSSPPPTRPLSRRLALWGLTTAFSGALCLLVLGVGEVVVRVVAPQQLILKRPDLWRPVDTLGWGHWADLHTTVNTGEGTVHLFTDDHGYRVGAAGRQGSRERILLLGDSFMEALQVEYEQSLSGLLQEHLAARPGGPVAIDNTGVGGWDPPQYLLQARSALSREPYRLVLVAVYVGNDVVDWRADRIPPRVPTEVHPWRLPRKVNFAEMTDALLYPLNDALEVRSQLFILLKNRARSLRMRLGLTAEWFPVEFLRTEAGGRRWTTTTDLCAAISALAAEHGTPTLFVLIPTSFQIEPDEFSRYLRGFDVRPEAVDLDQPQRLLAAALRARGLPVVDLLPALRTAAAHGERLYGEIDAHFSPAGHRVAAQVLTPVLDSLLTRARPARPDR